MAKTKISEWSTTPSSNTDIDGINIAEGCAPSGINDAIRDMMAQIRSWQSGASADPFNGPMNGTIGATTAYSGAFTTLSASSTVTLSGGTANGVTYLNGSKVLTSGSALTFDGTLLSNTGSGDRAKFGTGTRNIYIAGDSGGVSLFDGAGQTGNGWYISGASSYVAGYIGGSEQMRLTSTGLGIGTSSPAYKLDVSGAARISNGGDTYIGFGANKDNYWTTGTTSGKQVWRNSVGTEFMQLDSSGNLGLGVTPSAWGVTASQVKTASMWSVNNRTYIGANYYYNSVGTRIYINSDYATEYAQFNGAHSWYTAASGTAGTAISFTQAMTLDASGNLGIGTTSPASRLHVSGTFGNQLRLQETSGTFFDVTGGGRFDIRNNAGTTIVSIAQSGSPIGTQLNLDSSGNLGLGVVPSAWATYTALQVKNGSIANYSPTQDMRISSNAYYNAGWKYIASAFGLQYLQDGSTGQHAWFTAASGTAGGTISFTQAMSLLSDGTLAVGTTSGIGAGPSIISKGTSSGQQTYTAWNATTSGNPYFIEFGTEATYTARGSITYNRAGGLTVYNTTSDYRAKDISGPVTGSGALIDSVPVYMGKMKGATQERPMFIAHQTPDYAHTGEKDAVDKDGNPVYQQMDASALIPVMWAELQSLRKRLADANL